MTNISKININGVEYGLISSEQQKQIEELLYRLNHIDEKYLCGVKPQTIKEQNHCYTMKASELKDWVAPDYDYFCYEAEATTLITQYGNNLSNNQSYVLGCFKGDYITTEENDLITIYCGN